MHDDDNDTDDDDYEGNFVQEHNLYQFFSSWIFSLEEKKAGHDENWKQGFVFRFQRQTKVLNYVKSEKWQGCSAS